MGFAEVLVIIAVVLIVGGAVLYILKEKKKGKKCIGCPYANSCSRCTCGEEKKTEK